MATGGVTLTEDDLSCEICFNLYTDPKTLRCLHTFCGRCISQLAGNRRMVQCPNCRVKTNMSGIRNDFRIQKILDQHLGQVTGTSPSECDACGMCKKKGQSIQMYCADCDKLLCTMCCRIHADIKEIANHTTMSKTELITNYRSELQTKLDLLQETEKMLSGNLNELDLGISRIQQEQGSLIKAVDKKIEEAIHELNETRLELHKKIEDSDKNMFESMKISKATFLKEKADISGHITQICAVMVKDDIYMLKNVNSLINVPLTRPTVATSINFDNFPSIKVVSGSWSSTEVVKVVAVDDRKKADFSLLKNQISLDDHKITDFSVLRKKRYAECKSIKSKIHMINIIDDKLYCACGSSGINIYDKNCDFIKCITSEKFGYVIGMVDYGAGDIIVLTEAIENISGGLHQVTLQGRYVTHVTEQDFTDVCVYDGIVYGLIDSEIYLFQMKNSEWVKLEKIIELDPSYMFNSMCTSNEGIFISMYHPVSNINTIFVYNHEAQNMQAFANQSQSRWHPCVCSADSHSNLLVLLLDDKSRKTLLVHFKDENKWHEIMSVSSCLNGSECAYNAVVDERGDNIWVITSNRLIKFTRK